MAPVSLLLSVALDGSLLADALAVLSSGPQSALLVSALTE